MVRDRHSARAARRGFTTRGLMIFGLLSFSACARPDGVAAPLAGATFSESEQRSGARSEYRITSGAESIALTEWQPKSAPVAVILAVHGYGDYGSSTFDVAAGDWAERGILTYAYDQRGFGRNPSNGDWPGQSALVQDLATVFELIRKRHPELPITVLGHSMGGAVVTAALGEGAAKADKAVLLAPALWGGENLSPFLRVMAHAANTFSPDKRWTGDGIVKIQASDNIEMLRGLGRDPLYVRNPSSREFVGLIRLMDRAVNASTSVETSILVAWGEKDEVLAEEPILDAFEQFSGPKEYRRVETGWHMLLRDLEGKTVRDIVANFVLSESAS